MPIKITWIICILAIALGLNLVFAKEQITIAQNFTQEQPNTLGAFTINSIVPDNLSRTFLRDKIPQSVFIAPIDQALERVTKKPLGIKVSPDNSPVYPEVFSGYHSGVDFETYESEQNIDIPISAICTGTLRMKRWANGYGGVAVQDCTLEGQPISVIYGHLKLSSITADIATTLTQGDIVGVLGQGYSSETDNRRKHLHLGIHRGNGASILGYVQDELELEQWIDISNYLD